MPKKRLKCYFGCITKGPLHKFPQFIDVHEEKFNQWKSVLSHSTQKKGNKHIYHNIRLCNQHFEPFYTLPSGRLTQNAIPTLKLGNEIKCILCERTDSLDDKVVLSRIPRHPDICRKWVRNIGITDLVHKSVKELQARVFVCQSHFKAGSSNRDAPTENLIFPPLSDDLLKDFLTNNDSNPADENLNDDEINVNESKGDDKIVNNTHVATIEEIDSLFLRYADKFKKLSLKFQTKLKFEIAVLFARYEIKNDVLEDIGQVKPPEVSLTKDTIPERDKSLKVLPVIRKLPTVCEPVNKTSLKTYTPAILKKLSVKRKAIKESTTLESRIAQQKCTAKDEKLGLTIVFNSSQIDPKADYEELNNKFDSELCSDVSETVTNSYRIDNFGDNTLVQISSSANDHLYYSELKMEIESEVII